MPSRRRFRTAVYSGPLVPVLALLLLNAGQPTGVVEAAESAAAPTTEVERLSLDLWPAGPPDPPAEIGAEEELTRTPPDGILRLTNVTRPRITVFRPRKPNGAAVLVCPGGGYKILAAEHEGSAVCEFLNRHGVTAVLLTYRVPAPRAQPLQDAQRALGLIHHHADAWGVDRTRIGILGFSAAVSAHIRSTRRSTSRTRHRPS